MKKILVLASTFPRWKNDSSPPFVQNLCRSIKYQCTVLAPHDPKAKMMETLDGVEVNRFPYWWPRSKQRLCYGGGILPNFKSSFLAKMQLPFLFLSEYLWAKKLLENNEFSLIHAHWLLPQGFIAGLLKDKRNPLIISIHGTDLFGIKGFFSSKMQRYALRKADMITVNSTATKNELLRRFPDTKDKVQAIPMGVDTSLFKEKKFKSARKLLFVGRLSEQKGLQYLIPAISDIKDKKIKLYIVGEGPYQTELEKVAKNHGVLHRLVFLGAKSQPEIATLHANSIFILPSYSSKAGTEGLGVSLLEAMSSGCPIIATRSGGIIDVVRHKENGLLVDERNNEQMAKAIDLLLKNKSFAAKLGNSASLFVQKNYAWKIIGKKFERVYDGLT